MLKVFKVKFAKEKKKQSFGAGKVSNGYELRVSFEQYPPHIWMLLNYFLRNKYGLVSSSAQAGFRHFIRWVMLND